MSDQYFELKANPFKSDLKDNPRVVHINLIDSMDNKKSITFNKQSDGTFKMNTNGDAYSNFQFKNEKIELEWMIEDNEFQQAIEAMNLGTCKVSNVRGRY